MFQQMFQWSSEAMNVRANVALVQKEEREHIYYNQIHHYLNISKKNKT